MKALIFAVLTFLSMAVSAQDSFTTVMTVWNKSILQSDQDNTLWCNACSTQPEKFIKFEGDDITGPINPWYMAGPTVIARVDTGTMCPSGDWFAIDTYSHRVVQISVPTCEAINPTVIAYQHSIEFKYTQGGKNYRIVFSDEE